MNLLIILAHALRGAPWQGVQGLYWLIRRRRVRGWNMLYNAAMRSSGYYGVWVRYSEPRIFDEICPPVDALPLSSSRSSIHALIVTCRSPSTRDAQTTIESLRFSLGERVTIHLIDSDNENIVCVPFEPEETVQQWLAALADDDRDVWLLPVLAGDRMSPRFARAIDCAIANVGKAKIIYWDEDRLHKHSRRTPFLKPDWDPLLFLSRDILGGASMIRLDAAREAANLLDSQPISPEKIANIILSIATGKPDSAPPYHFPMILIHRAPGSELIDATYRKTMIEASWPEPVKLRNAPYLPESLSVLFPLPTRLPSVSIVIATRDRADLLKCCVNGVLANRYQGETEIVIVDNDSVEPETLAYFEEIRCKSIRILRHSGIFNYSAINNMAVKEARGEFICLLNNDIEMLDDDWLTAMMRHAVRPAVGAVGALLLYPDRTMQHAGVAVGVGNAAGHVHRKILLDALGHQGMHRTTRRASAVTAACLVVRRENFLAVGGLDEEYFKVAFNDVDLCLKLDRLGLHNIFVAEATLIHHESKSRGDDMLKANFARYSQELAYLQQKWSTLEVNDPYHHHLWLRSSEQCILRP